MKFVCIKTCFWVSLITRNQVVSVKEESEIPESVMPFFEKMEDFVKAEEEKKATEVKPEEITVSPDDNLETLQEKADKLVGFAYDRRWSADTLRAKITQFLKGM